MVTAYEKRAGAELTHKEKPKLYVKKPVYTVTQSQGTQTTTDSAIQTTSTSTTETANRAR